MKSSLALLIASVIFLSSPAAAELWLGFSDSQPANHDSHSAVDGTKAEPTFIGLAVNNVVVGGNGQYQKESDIEELVDLPLNDDPSSRVDKNLNLMLRVQFRID